MAAVFVGARWMVCAVSGHYLSIAVWSLPSNLVTIKSIQGGEMGRMFILILQLGSLRLAEERRKHDCTPLKIHA